MSHLVTVHTTSQAKGAKLRQHTDEVRGKEGDLVLLHTCTHTHTHTHTRWGVHTSRACAGGMLVGVHV